ncbi:hypothetical protein FF38_02611 [Lucilia cuprina]|uniref:Uncharacterized protein n=1 Tax=Lucilia cuprina TaxID=7375 RepID=A0A0L0CD72_LUCCU|nr:hypothetical protein FF38_02611 [Lucilia cuprina]
MSYVKCLSNIIEKLNKFHANSKYEQPPSTVNNISVDYVCHNLTLPPNIDRLCHLLRRTTGEAREAS